jgi:hypothetical protein
MVLNAETKPAGLNQLSDFETASHQYHNIDFFCTVRHVGNCCDATRSLLSHVGELAPYERNVAITTSIPRCKRDAMQGVLSVGTDFGLSCRDSHLLCS